MAERRRTNKAPWRKTIHSHTGDPRQARNKDKEGTHPIYNNATPIIGYLIHKTIPFYQFATYSTPPNGYLLQSTNWLLTPLYQLATYSTLPIGYLLHSTNWILTPLHQMATYSTLPIGYLLHQMATYSTPPIGYLLHSTN